MSGFVFAIVLFAALLHAGWNAIVKGGADTLLTTILVAGSAALLAAILLPWLRAPDAASWGFVLASVVIHVGYFALVARAYRLADMSQTYPLMRGVAPLLVALGSLVLPGAPLAGTAWVGIGLIGAGILGMTGGPVKGAANRGAIGGPALRAALLNAVVIASYTLVDGTGVRRSGAPGAYTLWVFMLTGVLLGAWGVARRRPEIGVYARRHWRYAVLGGAGSVASYGLVLWAMTVAPVAMVAALRETAILFGMAISGLVLKERAGLRRILAACVIASGAVALRLA